MGTVHLLRPLSDDNFARTRTKAWKKATGDHPPEQRALALIQISQQPSLYVPIL